MYDDFRHVIRDHVYDKCWLLDITWAEVEQLLDAGVVIEQHMVGDGDVKEILSSSSGYGHYTSCTS